MLSPLEQEHLLLTLCVPTPWRENFHRTSQRKIKGETLASAWLPFSILPRGGTPGLIDEFGRRNWACLAQGIWGSYCAPACPQRGCMLLGMQWTYRGRTHRSFREHCRFELYDQFKIPHWGGTFKPHNAINMLPKAILISSNLIPQSTSPNVLDLGGKSEGMLLISPLKFQAFVCLLGHSTLFVGNLSY